MSHSVLIKFDEFSKVKLASIGSLWHAKTYKLLSLTSEARLKPNIKRVSPAQFDRSIIAKYAIWEWDIGYYAVESQVYSWLRNHDIGPKFLSQITEGEDRVIGFLMEDIQGRHAGIANLQTCENEVRKLHALNIVHGNLNRHNFLIGDKGKAVLIDFETAKRPNEAAEMESELAGLEAALRDESGKGTMKVVN